ncbi:MAG: twin transmembrane helix small protein [Thermaurantiacus sp.]
MTALLVALIILAAGLTLWALVRGIMLMASGRDTLETGDGEQVSGLKSNRMMTMRVIFQAVTILLVVILFLVSGGSFVR